MASGIVAVAFRPKWIAPELRAAEGVDFNPLADPRLRERDGSFSLVRSKVYG